MPELAVIWFAIIAFLLAGYAVLDGFDLGAGAVHLFVARNDAERRQVLAAIGPVWDGNEVWLITGGGALFAAFPVVYGTVFSGFYLAMVLLLAALIVRGVSIEYRSAEAWPWWRGLWDVAFCLGSALAAILFGVALGNLLRGLNLDSQGVYRDGLLGLLNPFGLLMGVLTLALAVQQGCAWLALKTEGALAERARKTQIGALAAVIVLWLVLSAMAWAEGSGVDNFKTSFAPWIGPLVTVNAMFFGLRAAWLRQAWRSFLSSSLVVIGLAVTAAAAIYPNLVPAFEAGRSLTVANASSSNTALGAMLIVAAIGMPLVLAYSVFVYWKFKGKVAAEEAGYH